MSSSLETPDAQAPGWRDWIFGAVLLTCFFGALVSFIIWAQINASAAGGCGGG